MRRKMSRFVAEVLRIGPAPRRRAAARLRAEAIARHAPPVEPRPRRDADARRRDCCRLSSSRIDDYLTCPLKYRYAHDVPGAARARPGLHVRRAPFTTRSAHYYQRRLLGHPGRRRRTS